GAQVIGEDPGHRDRAKAVDARHVAQARGGAGPLGSRGTGGARHGAAIVVTVPRGEAFTRNRRAAVSPPLLQLPGIFPTRAPPARGSCRSRPAAHAQRYPTDGAVSGPAISCA